MNIPRVMLKLLCGMALVLGSGAFSFPEKARLIGRLHDTRGVEEVKETKWMRRKQDLVHHHWLRQPAAIQLNAGEATLIKATRYEENMFWSWNVCLWCAIVAFYSLKAGRALFLVVYSALAGLIGLTRWMWSESVRVERGSMAHFACRGATIAVLLSFLWETCLQEFISFVSPNLGHYMIRTGFISAMGGVEELAKMMSLVWWSSCATTAKLWPRSQKGVMLAGFSVGVGMMVAENCECCKAAIGMLLWKLMHAIARHNMTGVDQLFVALNMLVVYRILLNPHPWLTGIVAGRLAKSTSKSTEQSTVQLKTLWTVIWPSTVLHALLNVVA